MFPDRPEQDPGDVLSPLYPSSEPYQVVDAGIGQPAVGAQGYRSRVHFLQSFHVRLCFPNPFLLGKGQGWGCWQSFLTNVGVFQQFQGVVQVGFLLGEADGGDGGTFLGAAFGQEVAGYGGNVGVVAADAGTSRSRGAEGESRPGWGRRRAIRPVGGGIPARRGSRRSVR